MEYVYFHNLRKEMKKVKAINGNEFLMRTFEDQNRLKDAIVRELRIRPLGAVLLCYDGGKK